ncbi:MAG: DUF488 domain-containing protein [Candidatus Promineofilum sp.]|nr:DUF488 domain-containing protein [Promineifilum sp.]
MDANPVYTIGYGRRDVDELIATLRRYGIAFLIDVRSRPHSRYKPDFSKERLEAHLQRADIRYVFMGDALGGLPDDPACYTSTGKADYAKIAEQDFYRRGIDRLMKAQTQGLAVSIMCSEGKPENCHRSKLIGKTLAQRGVPVAHIDENDDLIGQADVLLRLTGGQPSLFGDDLLPGTSRKRYDRTGGEPEDEPDE